MSNRDTIIENIKKILDNGDIVKCYIEQHYLREKDLKDKKALRNCDKHIYCYESCYSLINREGVYLMKTNQWHTCHSSSCLDSIVNKWFNKNGKLTQFKDSITFTEYIEHPKS